MQPRGCDADPYIPHSASPALILPRRPVVPRYATSVGSKALTIRQACGLALVFEFAGAVTAGSAVADTIRKGIADIECFEDNSMDGPILMYGNLCVIMIVGFWLLLATRLEMPVSTTHSCVGGMIGMALAAKGSSCIVWNKESDEDRLWIPQGVVGIVISWVLSPFLSAFFAVALFWGVRKFILRSKNSFNRALNFYPLLIFLAVWINVFFIISKGVSKKLCPYDKATGEGDNWFCNAATKKKSGKVLPLVAMGVAAGIAVLVTMLCYPVYSRIRRWVTDDFAGGQKPWYAVSGSIAAAKDASKAAAVASAESIAVGSEKLELADLAAGSRTASYRDAADETEVGYLDVEACDTAGATAKADASAGDVAPAKLSRYQRLSAAISLSTSIDVHATGLTNETAAAIHEHAEKFDDQTEAVFRYIQIFTAICDSFAHGANDVANAMGPFMAIYMIYNNGEVGKKADSDDDAYWILALGGIGIGLGLLLYGYKIIRAIGVKLSKITPSRGFAIELGAAIVIIIGSYIGLPLSTTHCQVGATTGVALMEGGKGINKKALLVTATGWVITLAVAGVGAGLLTAFGLWAPLAPELQRHYNVLECPQYAASQYTWLDYSASNDTLSVSPINCAAI